MNERTPQPNIAETASTSPLTISDSGGREGKFRAHDGAVIRYAWWRGDRSRRAGTVVYFNGRTEFIEKNLETVGELVGRGFDVWTLDWRGQGLSQRALGNRHKGHIDDYSQHLGDLRLFFRDYVESKPRERFVLLGHSMGGHIALRTLHELPNRFTHAVLTSPLIAIQGSNIFVRTGQKLLSSLGAWPFLSLAYVPGTGDYGPDSRRFEGNVLTSDEERFMHLHARIDANPDLALGGPTLGWLNATHRSISTIAESTFAAAINTPLLIVSAGDDKVVSNAAQQAIAERLPQGRLETIEGARHEILLEQNRHREEFWRLFDEFVLGEESGGERAGPSDPDSEEAEKPHAPEKAMPPAGEAS